MFVGRVIPNKKFEDVIRAFHAYRTRHNPRSRLLLVGSYSGFERYLAMLHVAHRAARHARRALPRPRVERGADGALRRRRSVPLRQRARGLLRADRRGVLQARAGARLRGDRRAGDDGRRRRALRRRKDPLRDRAADGRRPRRSPTSRTRSSQSQDAALDAAARAGTSAARCCRFVDRLAGAGRRAGARGRRGTSGRSSTSSSGSRSCASSGRRCSGRCRNDAGCRDSAIGARDCPTDRARTPIAAVVEPPSPPIPDRRIPSPTMIINQWVPAAHRGDAIGDSARRVRDMLRARGPRSRTSSR